MEKQKAMVNCNKAFTHVLSTTSLFVNISTHTLSPLPLASTDARMRLLYMLVVLFLTVGLHWPEVPPWLCQWVFLRGRGGCERRGYGTDLLPHAAEWGSASTYQGCILIYSYVVCVCMCVCVCVRVVNHIIKGIRYAVKPVYFCVLVV